MIKYAVEQVENITPTTLLLSLRVSPGEQPLSFQAGQYAAISFYHNQRPTPARCFSFVSSPNQENILQFCMRKRGRFTTGLSLLGAGDAVQVRGPYGGFVIDFVRDSDIVLIAGGIGITPFMSMIRTLSSMNSPLKAVLMYSCATQDDIPFLEELSKHEMENTNLSIVFMIGKGPVDKLVGRHAGQGRITPDLINQICGGQYSTQTFFICGPPPFMNAMVSNLQSKGTNDAQIVTEAFAQGLQRQSSMFRSWPRSVYALSTAGFALSGFAIMAGDLIKTLPPSTYLGTSSISTKTVLTNSRQTDLDALVNHLPTQTATAPESSAVTGAFAASVTPAQTVDQTAPVAASTPIAANRQIASSGTYIATNTQASPAKSQPAAGVAPAKPAATPAPVLAPTPAPAPVKHCTTTQSGVTTCI